LSVFHHADLWRRYTRKRVKSVPVIAVWLIIVSSASAQVQRQRSRATTGPSAASLATPYSGPLKFNPRVLALERSANHDADPITRAARWRYRYSAPACFYWGSYGSGYYNWCGRGFYPFTGGATGLGWWGPY
jgi:hypothetical protein